MTYETVFLVPTQEEADAINAGYRQSLAHEPSRKFKAIPMFSHPAAVRGHKVVVFPVPDHYTSDRRALYLTAADMHCRMIITPEGRVVRL